MIPICRIARKYNLVARSEGMVRKDFADRSRRTRQMLAHPIVNGLVRFDDCCGHQAWVRICPRETVRRSELYYGSRMMLKPLLPSLRVGGWRSDVDLPKSI